MRVIKRDGREVQFDWWKVYNAVLKAMMSVDPEVSNEESKLAIKIADYIQALDKDISVETIQDMVEQKLMQSKRKDVAKAYIIYRNDRSRIRQNKSELIEKVREKITASNIENQNANVDEKSFGGRMGAVNSAVLKQYALDNCMSEMSRNNHLNNEIYIHDLDHYASGDHNCLSLPFDDLLANGFNTRQTDVRPAQSINTAFQLVAVIFQIQSLQQFGGVAATHLDWTMVPYVRKSFFKHYKDGLKYVCGLSDDAISIETTLADGFTPADISIEDNDAYAYADAARYAMDMTVKELYQAVEGMYHNLNVIWAA